MTPEQRSRLAQLLLGERVLALGVVVEGAPIVGLLPYAVAEDGRALYVQASSLARHSRGLVAGAPWSGIVRGSDAPDADPLRIPRLMLEGIVEPLPGEHPEFAAAARAFLKRFPQAAMTLSLADFALYRLALRGGRLVLDFGEAINLSGEHFEGITTA